MNRQKPLFKKMVVNVILAMLILYLAGQSTFATETAIETEPAYLLTSDQQEPPLRHLEPVEAVIADLESYIPGRMRQADIPGLAIALIRNNKVVWTEGFGVANTITGRPVTPETVFEVASNSKVVAAYTALRLVDQGKLALDVPASSYLAESWLPPSEYAGAITLRHLLSHSAGLGHNTSSRDSLFAPGADYSYSAIGFVYLQEIIEQTTGQSLEEVAREVVFKSLRMSSSSYINQAEILPRMANGHIWYIAPLLLFIIPFGFSLSVVGLVGVLILRLKTGQWRPTRRMVGVACLVAASLFLLPAFIFLRHDLPEFVLLIALCGVALASLFAAMFFAGHQIMARLPAAWQGTKLRRVLAGGWSVLSVVALLWLASSIIGPVPKGPSPRASAAGSMRATAGDLALFLLELADPQYLSQDTAAQMRSPQASASADISWGLGPGIQHSRQGDALWQWGQTLDFQSVMIIYPDQGIGVVVLTNSDLFHPLIVFDVAQRALGGHDNGIRRAANLEFNR